MQKMRKDSGMTYLCNVVSVVGTGPSAANTLRTNGPPPGIVIAVNEAMRYVDFDIGLTMDGTFAMKTLPLIMRNRPKNLFYVRRSAYDHMCNEHPAQDWVGRNDLTVYQCDVECTEFNKLTDTIVNRKQTGLILNGDHSGYNALALTHTLRPQTVLLYGFDLGSDLGHFFGNYKWHGKGSRNTHRKFLKWREDMHAARKQFDDIGARVVNMNPKSAIDAFEKVKKC